MPRLRQDTEDKLKTATDESLPKASPAAEKKELLRPDGGYCGQMGATAARWWLFCGVCLGGRDRLDFLVIGEILTPLAGVPGIMI